MGFDHFSRSDKMNKVLGLLLFFLCCQSACAYNYGWESRSYDFHDDMWMNSVFGYYPSSRNYYFNNFNNGMYFNWGFQSYPISRSQYFYDDMSMEYGFQSYPMSL